jgi:hypothetical protein
VRPALRVPERPLPLRRPPAGGAPDRPCGRAAPVRIPLLPAEQGDASTRPTRSRPRARASTSSSVRTASRAGSRSTRSSTRTCRRATGASRW